MKPFIFTLRIDSLDADTIDCQVWNESEENSFRYHWAKSAVSFTRKNSMAHAIASNQHQLRKILTSAMDGKLHVGKKIHCVFLKDFHFLDNAHFNGYIRLDRRQGRLDITTSDTGLARVHKIYADGSSNHETNQSGYGGFIEAPDGERELFFEPFTGGSSNLMELLAVIEGLQRLGDEQTVQINTDSRFVIRGLAQWIHFWRHNSWQTAYGRDVRYQAYWQRADSLCAGKYMEFKWIKGHSGNMEQAFCHLLAKAAAAKAPKCP